jgi:chromosome segregation ATPase
MTNLFNGITIGGETYDTVPKLEKLKQELEQQYSAIHGTVGKDVQRSLQDFDHWNQRKNDTLVRLKASDESLQRAKDSYAFLLERRGKLDGEMRVLGERKDLLVKSIVEMKQQLKQAEGKLMMEEGARDALVRDFNKNEASLKEVKLTETKCRATQNGLLKSVEVIQKELGVVMSSMTKEKEQARKLTTTLKIVSMALETAKENEQIDRTFAPLQEELQLVQEQVEVAPVVMESVQSVVLEQPPPVVSVTPPPAVETQLPVQEEQVEPSQPPQETKKRKSESTSPKKEKSKHSSDDGEHHGKKSKKSER